MWITTNKILRARMKSMTLAKPLRSSSCDIFASLLNGSAANLRRRGLRTTGGAAVAVVGIGVAAVGTGNGHGAANWRKKSIFALLIGIMAKLTIETGQCGRYCGGRSRQTLRPAMSGRTAEAADRKNKRACPGLVIRPFRCKFIGLSALSDAIPQNMLLKNRMRSGLSKRNPMN